MNIYEFYNVYINTERKSRKLIMLPELKKGTKLPISGYVFERIKNTDDYIKGKNIIYFGTYKCISKGTWALEPLANVYKCRNYGIYTYRFGTNISFIDSANTFNKLENGVEYIKKSLGLKKTLCVSLISMCNNKVACNLATNVSGIHRKVKISLTEPEVLERLRMLQDSNFIVVSFPLSTPIKGVVKLFDIEKYKTEHMHENDHLTELYSLIDTSDPKSTFESIVKIVLYYLVVMKKEGYELCFHCKSGKDRTSVFDAVTQATIKWFRTKKRTTLNDGGFEEIRLSSQKYLFYGLQIAYYGTSFVGLKLNSIPVAKYILDSHELYNFYSGHSKYAMSSR